MRSEFGRAQEEESGEQDGEHRLWCLQDNLIPMHELVPPLKGVAGQGLTQMARQPLIPVQVILLLV